MEILFNAGAALAYGAVGMTVMVVGYLIVDLLTPGRLHKLIWEDGNRNATLMVSANTLGVAIIVVSAIFASHYGVAEGLITTAVYGGVGLLLMAVAFLVIDLLTPAKIGDILKQTQLHPATWVNASSHIGVALVVAAAIS
ncbi:uncharacterized membrane protein YjfL (UPF0719 family) [Nocardiopsis mwathae]|uniref:Uncharacterized membrane protein YjfL (UPF0719 family) n=1 Tax=Nocardiopsis mwathae TaxID=1472723 RepID=A0A7X0D7C9_9ACTN|nr:DUF350 domain-containing protein [Nocardiopsis mwathae]MBB6173601.1 uncharacterized membrane protein YjfL (UPF0719 family) [Nocardiopsis mwathae]